MSGQIKGITIEIDGNVKPLKKAITSLNSTTGKLKTELRGVTSLLKMDPGNVTLIKQKQDLLNQSIAETKNKLKTLEAAEAEASAKMAAGEEINQEEYRNLQREIVSTQQKLKALETEAKTFGANASAQLLAVSGKMEAFGNKATAAGSKLKTLSTAATVGLAAAVKTTMDFDEGMSQVQATTGAAGKELETLRTAAISAGSTTAFTATEASEALNYLALAGYDSTKAINTLPTVLNLAAAGSMGLEDATEMVTKSMNALGLSVGEATTFTDQMAKTSQKSGTTVSELGEAILTVGATAKNLKGGTVELNTVLGILADNGYSASEGGTKLRNIMLSLSAPTSAASKQLEELGVSVFDSSGNMRSMGDIMQDLNSSMSGLTAEAKTKAIANIFNKRDIGAVNGLLGTSADRWAELTSEIESADGTAEEMADTMLDNLSGAITIMKSALEAVGIVIGDTITPALRALADWMGEVAQKFANSSQAVKNIVSALVVMTAAVAPALIALGKLSKALSVATREIAKLGTADSGLAQLGARLKKLGSSITALIAKMRAYDTSKITSAIATARMTAATTLETVAMKISESRFTAGAKKVLAYAAAHKVALASSLGLVGGIAALAVYMGQTGKSADEVAAQITTFANNIASAIDQFSAQLPQIIEQITPVIIQAIESIIQTIPLVLPALIAAGVQLFLGLVQSITQVIQPIVAALPSLIQGIASGLITLLPALITAGVQLFTALIDAIPQVIPQIIAALPQIIQAIVTGLLTISVSILKLGVKLIKMLWQGIASWIGNLKAKVVGFAKNIPKYIKSGLGSLVSVGGDFIKGLWTGIQAKFKSVLNKIKGIAAMLPKAVKKVLGINSPSKVMAEVGQWIPLGLAKGIESKTQSLLATASSQVASLSDTYAGVNLADGSMTAAASGGTTVNQTVNINQPVSSPIETARALRRQASLGLAGA